MRIITLETLRDHDACEDQYDHLVKSLGHNDDTREITLAEILKHNGIEDAVWALKTQEYRDICLFCADVAEITLPIYEQQYPNDSRVRDCIKAIRDWHNGDIDDDALYAARDDAWDDALYAVWDSARDSAWDAAWDDASCSARDAAWYDTWYDTWDKIIEIFKKHFC